MRAGNVLLLLPFLCAVLIGSGTRTHELPLEMNTAIERAAYEGRNYQPALLNPTGKGLTDGGTVNSEMQKFTSWLYLRTGYRYCAWILQLTNEPSCQVDFQRTILPSTEFAQGVCAKPPSPALPWVQSIFPPLSCGTFYYVLFAPQDSANSVRFDLADFGFLRTPYEIRSVRQREHRDGAALSGVNSTQQ